MGVSIGSSNKIKESNTVEEMDGTPPTLLSGGETNDEGLIEKVSGLVWECGA